MELDQEALAFLALSTIEGVGYWTLRRLADRGESFHETLHIGSESLRAAGKRPNVKQASAYDGKWDDLRESALKRANALADKLHERRVQLLFRRDKRFPPALTDLSDCPAWLFVRGDAMLLHRPSLTVVGTRSPSDIGLSLAWYIGDCFPLFAVPVVSGLALGVDQSVHESALAHGLPTVAILGTGILREFPSGSGRLADRIVEDGGAIVSEYLPNQSYSRENFVRRNRIQAALSKVTIPVEWSLRSGTAHTVKFATELGRTVICLRARRWSEPREELAQCIVQGGHCFTIPGEEDGLLRAVCSALSSENTEPTKPVSISESASDPRQLRLI